MSNDPTPGNNKAFASGCAGAIVIIIAWILDTFWKVAIPIEVAAAAQTVIVTAAVYFVPHGEGPSSN